MTEKVTDSDTNASLLVRLQQAPADQAAWAEFVRRYGARIHGWCRRWGLQEADAQEVSHTPTTAGRSCGRSARPSVPATASGPSPPPETGRCFDPRCRRPIRSRTHRPGVGAAHWLPQPVYRSCRNARHSSAVRVFGYGSGRTGAAAAQTTLSWPSGWTCAIRGVR